MSESEKIKSQAPRYTRNRTLFMRFTGRVDGNGNPQFYPKPEINPIQDDRDQSPSSEIIVFQSSSMEPSMSSR